MDISAPAMVDLGVLGILALSGALAFARGLVRELFALGTWIGAAVATALLYPKAKPWVHARIHSEMAADAATAVGLFCLALAVLVPIGLLLSSLVRGKALTAIDRSLGFVFGLARGLLILSLFQLCVNWIWPQADEQPDFLAKARSRPVLLYGGAFLDELIPKDTRRKAEEELRKGQEKAEQAVEDAKRLEEMTTLVPAVKKKDAPAYESGEQNRLNNLVDQKGKP